MTNPYAPPSANVYDVTDRNAGMVPADRGTRLGAAILDGIVLSALVYLPVLVGVALSYPWGTPTPSPDLPAGLLFGLLGGCAGFAIWSYFTISYVRRNGQSIAKKWLDIKVVRADGSPASLGRIFWLRNVVNGLVGVVPILGIVYSIVDLLFVFSESRQCLHDKLADTIVVNA